MAAMPRGDGLTNGCSTIGISKSPPVEIMEQTYPVLYRRYALREGSGGAGEHRGGFGLAYEVELLRGEARASFVMDHGRVGPQGALGGGDGAVNKVTVIPRRRGACAAASVEGAGHSAEGRRPGARRHAGRRRLWRSRMSAIRRSSRMMWRWDITQPANRRFYAETDGRRADRPDVEAPSPPWASGSMTQRSG